MYLHLSILFVLGIQLFLICMLIIKVHALSSLLNRRLMTMTEEHEDFSDENETISRAEMTEYEELVQQREREFDERIERIKEELDNKQVGQRKGTTAEILHPGVENLPHDSIPTHGINPNDIEVAD